jgi:uncharacterized protein (DUF427 family)
MPFSTRPRPDPIGPGQESCWDYPRPPRLEPVTARLRVVLGGMTVADTTRGLRVLETSHPPNYYVPVADVRPGALVAVEGASFCEWKGRAGYYDVVATPVEGGAPVVATRAAWGYDTPSPAFARLRDHVAFYAGPMDACFVDDEMVTPQPGGFYGGWITAGIAGPFKGEPGTRGW